jgi:ElaB/YqjD/DUF883 family membrane-anchored ribosome-binding protein
MAQDPGEVRQAIEQDRLELADTVQALAQKADVKQRVRESVSKNADQLQNKANDVVSKVRGVTPDQVQSGLGSATESVRQRPFPFAVAGAFFVGLLLGRLMGRGGGDRAA